jgi:hypothetical protein
MNPAYEGGNILGLPKEPLLLRVNDVLGIANVSTQPRQ